MRHTRPALFVVAALLALTGCSGGSAADTSDASATVGHHHKKQHAAKATSPAAKPSASATAASGPSSCRTRDLLVAVTEGEGAAGSTYYRVVLTNTSATTCRTGGFGGVSLVGDDNGTQIGAPADRTQADRVERLTLEPGAKAQATLQLASADNYSAARCRPAAAEGFRVYPPDETRSAFVPTGTTGCRNEAVHLLTLTPYALVG
jgi:hypothetical protein